MGSDGRAAAIVCAQPVARAGLEQIVRECPGFVVRASAGTVEEVLPAGPDDRCQVTIIDLPAGAGEAAVEAIAKLAALGPPVVVSAWEQPDTLLAAIRAGARGAVTRYAEPAAVGRAISTVADGGISIAAELTALFLDELRRPARAGRSTLAPREAETLRWIAHGYTQTQIATRMGLSAATVNTYAKRIRSKLKVTDRADLARLAIELGHVAPGRRP